MLRIVKSRLLKAYSVRYQHFTLHLYSRACIFLARFSSGDRDSGFPIIPTQLKC